MAGNCDLCGEKLGFRKFHCQDGVVCKKCYAIVSNGFSETIAKKTLTELKKTYEAMRKQPELMQDIFQRIERELLTYIKIAVEYGVDMISYADSSGGVNILGPKMTEQVVMDFTYDFLKKAIELLDGKTMLLLCPKTTLALIGTEKACYMDRELPEVMRYGEACVSLIGRVPVAGQMCIKNIDYQLENKKFREIRLY